MKLKKWVFVLFALALIFLLPTQAEAAIVDSGTCGENLTWTLDDAGKLTISGTGDMNEYMGHAPWGTDIKTVVIQDGVTSIGYAAFSGSEELNSVTLSNSMTKIGDYAFEGCVSLVNITLPNSLQHIGLGSFMYCPKLSSIKFPSGMCSISSNAFMDCNSLKEITIPSSVYHVGFGAFAGCDNLIKIYVDSTSISYYSDAKGALYTKDQTELLAVPGAMRGTFSIPNGVTTINAYALSGCSNLTAVTIPNSVTKIEIGAFQGCESLKSITIPDSVHSIDTGAFEWCSNLTSAKLSNTLTSISPYLFADCTNLTSIVIPDGVTIIDDGAFSGCSSLKTITLPDRVTAIGYYAFLDCESIVSIQLPNSLTRIDECAFRNCKSLLNINIPNSVTSIGDGMFSFCTELKSVTLSQNASVISEEMFSHCEKLTSITFPKGVTSIGYNAFSDCTSLKEIRFSGNAPIFSEDVFCFIFTNITAYYPANNATWTADVMQDYGGDITWVSYDPNNYIPNVVINKVIAHKTGNILYWDAVPGADIYQIYRLNGSKWELLKNTRSLGYKDETAKPGVKHYYKIVARNGDAKSDIKTTISASAIRPDTKLANVVINKTIAHSSGNIMYWDAVPGADLYQVYRLRSGDSSWTLLKNTRSLGYKDTTATPGVRYYYKIVARNGDVKSNIATTASTLIVRP